MRSFLLDGVAGIAGMRPPEKPAQYDVHSFLTFALSERPRWRMLYPSVFVANTGRRYRGLRVFSQGDRTKDGAQIFTVQLQPDDDGEVQIYYAPGERTTVRVQRGQSAVVTKPIGPGVTAPETVSIAKA